MAVLSSNLLISLTLVFRALNYNFLVFKTVDSVGLSNTKLVWINDNYVKKERKKEKNMLKIIYAKYRKDLAILMFVET